VKGPVHTQAAQVGARRIGGESLGAWGMPPRLLALAVLGLISLDAAASLAHGEPVQGQIPFRYARPTRNRGRGNARTRASAAACAMRYAMADADEGGLGRLRRLTTLAVARTARVPSPLCGGRARITTCASQSACPVCGATRPVRVRPLRRGRGDVLLASR